jgi:hypothetical protein
MNNIIKTKGSAIYYSPPTSVYDYNFYSTPNYYLVYNWNLASICYLTLQEFQSNANEELHGKTGDPVFIDSQLHIASSSPAVNFGGIIANFNDANSAWPYSGSAPDMGAYELP